MDSSTFFVYSIFVPLIFFSLYVRRKNYWFPAIIVIILYTILMGYRYDVGFDWMQYKDNFVYCRKGIGNMVRDYEPVYSFLNLLLSRQLGLHYWSLMLLECFLYLYSMFLFCRLAKDRLAAAIACTLFYCISFFNAINTSREFLALSFFMIGNYLLIDNKVTWSKELSVIKRIFNIGNVMPCVFMLLGAFTHFSMVLYPILFFAFIFYQPSKLNFKYLVCIYILILFFFKIYIHNEINQLYGFIFLLTDGIQDERFSIYVDRDFLGLESRHFQAVSLMRTLLFAIIDIFILYSTCLLYNLIRKVKYKYICVFAIIYVLFNNAVQDFELLRRLTYVFLPFFSLLIGELCVVYKHHPLRNIHSLYNCSLMISLYFVFNIILFLGGINWKVNTYGKVFEYKIISNIESVL